MNFQTMQELANKLREQANNLEKEIVIEDFPCDILFDFDWSLYVDSSARWCNAMGEPRTERAKKLQERLNDLVAAIMKSNYMTYGLSGHPAYMAAIKALKKSVEPVQMELRLNNTIYLSIRDSFEQWIKWIKMYPKLKIINYSIFEEALDKELKAAENRYQVLLKAKEDLGSRAVEGCYRVPPNGMIRMV